MEELAAMLYSGKNLYVLSNEQFRKLGLKKKLKVETRLDEDIDSFQITCYLSSNRLNNSKIYILPDEFKKMPNYIYDRLSVIDIRPAKDRKRLQLSSLVSKMDNKEENKKTFSPKKIVLTDDSIIPRCKSASILVEDKKYSVIGYISKTTGSLLIPASIFLKNVPMDSWSKLKLSDPKKLLPQQGFQGVSFDVDENDLQECSILFKYGYSVKKSVPFDVRRKALNAAIMDHAVTKEQAIQHIKRLITLNRNRYPDACARWRDDIEYLEQMLD